MDLVRRGSRTTPVRALASPVPKASAGKRSNVRRKRLDISLVVLEAEPRARTTTLRISRFNIGVGKSESSAIALSATTDRTMIVPVEDSNKVSDAS